MSNRDACLQLNDALLDSVFDDESRGVDGLELSETVRAIDGLHFGSGVPPPARFGSHDTKKSARQLPRQA